MRSILSKFLKKKAEQQTPSLKNNIKSSFPLLGFTENLQQIPFVDYLSNEDLTELNNLLDWNCFVADVHGRRFGNVAWSGKRDKPEKLPDWRHSILDKKINLSSKHVLEIGCFEGIHTISLCKLAGRVTAIDSRMENVVKTIVRTALFGYHPTVFKVDVENWHSQLEMLKSDVCHHIGVLYHLKDPVKHLLQLCSIVQEGILLDTHFAMEDQAVDIYEVNGKSYPYKKYSEGKDVFSGMYDHAKWLTLKGLEKIFRDGGFNIFEIVEERNERNGPRVLLWASRLK
jgi:tRNA (mo5U34)-methyltransferase